MTRLSILSVVFGSMLVVLAVFVVDWHFPKTSSEHRHPDKYDLLYENIAVEHVRPDFCRRISPLAYWTASWNAPGKQVGLMRSSCFSKLAINERNVAYCDEVQPINTWLLNGSEETPDACRALIRRGVGNQRVGGTFLRAAFVRELLQEMKFDYLADADYQREASIEEESALREYWSKVAHTDEFVARSMKLPHPE